MGIQISVQVLSFDSFRHNSEVEWLGQMVILFLFFGGTAILFSTAAAPFSISIIYILFTPQNTVRWILLILHYTD